MHMKNLSVAFVLMAGLVSGCGRVASPLSVYQVEPLVKVLPCDSVFVDSPDTMHVAKGESASFQFVITTSQNVSGLQADVCPDKLGEVKTGWVHDVHNENPTHGADDMIVTPDNNYPDPIIDDEQEDLSAGKKKTLWAFRLRMILHRGVTAVSAFRPCRRRTLTQRLLKRRWIKP